MAGKGDSIQEEWRAIEGWPYEVSNLGRVRRTVGRCGTRAGKILRTTPNNAGYPRVFLFDRRRSWMIHVHRLVAEAFLGKPPDGRDHVAHNDGDKTNNTPTNLRWDNPAGNASDRTRHGTENRGERNGQSRLNGMQVREIRRLHALGIDRREIGRAFDVHYMYVSAIASRRAWPHLV